MTSLSLYMFLVFWINIVFWYSSKFYYSYSLVLARAWPFYYDAERRGYILFGIDFIFFITARQSAKNLREGGIILVRRTCLFYYGAAFPHLKGGAVISPDISPVISPLTSFDYDI